MIINPPHNNTVTPASFCFMPDMVESGLYQIHFCGEIPTIWSSKRSSKKLCRSYYHALCILPIFLYASIPIIHLYDLCFCTEYLGNYYVLLQSGRDFSWQFSQRPYKPFTGIRAI